MNVDSLMKNVWVLFSCLSIARFIWILKSWERFKLNSYSNIQVFEFLANQSTVWNIVDILEEIHCKKRLPKVCKIKVQIHLFIQHFICRAPKGTFHAQRLLIHNSDTFEILKNPHLWFFICSSTDKNVTIQIILICWQYSSSYSNLNYLTHSDHVEISYLKL